MFAGIVEAKSPIVAIKQRDEVVEIQIKRPTNFDDLKIGDSIAVNGVCLTLEAFDEVNMQFAVGFETLKITHWSLESLNGLMCNLESSLRLGDRIHGHLMSGHVEANEKVVACQKVGENLLLDIQVPANLKAFLWKKGGVCLNGVSLTINEINNDKFSVCVIPESLRQTNLGELKVNDRVNLEADYFAKAMHHFWELKNASN